MATAIEGLHEAERLVAQLRSDRHAKLDRLERYVLGTQYEGRPDFLAPEVDSPLLERAPNIVYPAVAAAIRQHSDFALGEGRFPTLSTGQAEDESGLDDDLGLSEPDSKTLDAFLSHLCEHLRLSDVCQDALDSAESVGSVAAVLCARMGRLEVETIDAKDATPVFCADGRSLLAIDISYPFVDVTKTPNGKRKARVLIYRRVVDATSDTVYIPAEVESESVDPVWKADPAQTVEHGLGFCPAVWYAFKRKGLSIADYDGHAIHEHIMDELDALNFGLSQRGRAALYSGDPQMYETGVRPGEDPAPLGRSAVPVSDGMGGIDATYRFNTSERPRNARRKGAGTVWTYESEESKVGLLVLPGDALKAIDQHCADLEEKISIVLGHTKASPEQVRGAVSGKALGFLFSATTSFCDRVRSDLWAGFMAPLLSLALRMVAALPTGSLYIVGARNVQGLLRGFMRSVTGMDEPVWFGPRITPTWGAYFTPTSMDELETVRTVAEARRENLIPIGTALEKLRSVFRLDNVAAIVDALDAEKASAPDSAPDMN